MAHSQRLWVFYLEIMIKLSLMADQLCFGQCGIQGADHQKYQYCGNKEHGSTFWDTADKGCCPRHMVKDA